MGHHGEATAVVESSPDEVFAIITDIERLPDWNDAIRAVKELPPALAPGAQWVVDVHAMGSTWASRSEVVELDPDAHRFVYRTQTDDGNPSFAIWRWAVDPHPAGAEVSVSYDLNPRTFWRKHLLVHLRRPGLAKELRVSLDALRGAVGVR